MPISSMYQGELEELANVRGGEGVIGRRTVFQGDELETPTTGVAYMVIPPGASIGQHEHAAEQDFYAILEGQGVALVDGVEHEVQRGDILVNSLGGDHALQNTGQSDLLVLAWCVSCPPASG